MENVRRQPMHSVAPAMSGTPRDRLIDDGRSWSAVEARLAD
jgi:hypothetical protein